MNGGGRPRAEPRSMEVAGAGLSRIATDLGAAMSRLRADLAEQGSPWGDDELGRCFGNDYLQTARQAFHAIGTYRDQIQYAATRLRAGGQRSAAGERDNTTEFETVWPVPPDQQ